MGFLTAKVPFLSRVRSKRRTDHDADSAINKLSEETKTKDSPLRKDTRKDTAITAYFANDITVDLTAAAKEFDGAESVLSSCITEAGPKKNDAKKKPRVTHFDFTRSREVGFRKSGSDMSPCAAAHYKSNNLAVPPQQTDSMERTRAVPSIGPEHSISFALSESSCVWGVSAAPGDIPELNIHESQGSASAGSTMAAMEGPRGSHYDPSSVRFFYGKRWADGMCDAMGKPWNILKCIVPCYWPITTGTAAVRARPLIYGFGTRYLQVTNPMWIRISVYLFAFLSLLFVLGIFCITLIGLGDVPSEFTAEEWIGVVFFAIGIPGPILWGLTHVAIRNRYRVNESPCSTFLKSVMCPCLFSLRVKRHVDQAQGFKKPKGMLMEALWATNMQYETALTQEQMGSTYARASAYTVEKESNV